MFRWLFRITALLLAYCWWVEPARLRVTEQTVTDPSTPLADPVRVLWLSDLHLGRWSRAGVLRAKIKTLARLHARRPFDLVLLGGDFIDAEARWLPQFADVLSQIAGLKVPTYAVLGNHDYTSFPDGVGPLVDCLQAHGVTVLRSQAERVRVGAQPLLLVGLDDLQESEAYYDRGVYRSPAQYREAAAQMDWYARFDGVAPEMPRLLLAHNPDAVYLPGRRPLAVLAGHTHGGQIFLLDWVSEALHGHLHVHLPPGSFVTWAGRQEIAGRTLIVSHGFEGASLPIRLLRPPEAVIVTLR